MNNYQNLMKGRLGYYIGNNNIPNSTEGVNDMSARLQQHGGNLQQQRMIKDKLRSLRRALYYSYQGADIQLLTQEETNPVRALINPNRLKQDYDDKTISVEYNQGFECGSVFEWKNTNTYWLIYLQDLTELAYFRGDIRRCKYQIAWEDANGEIQKTHVAVRGPVETKIDSIIKNDISLDLPNHTLNILLPYSPGIYEYFQRYNKFYLQGNPTCWRIEAVDNISTPGIIELTAIEYYSNKDKDNIEEGIVDAYVFEEQDPNPIDEPIVGDTFIKPKGEYTYSLNKELEGSWSIESQYPVTWSVSADNKITLQWTRPHSGQFVLKYGSEEKTIIVESLF